MRAARAGPGFTLVELLVALAVFAVMAALAYGGLAAIARTRGALAAEEDAFRDLTRAVATFDRDLREAVARPVVGNVGQTLPAFVGGPGAVEFTRLGFANPQAEPRSNLERVLYELDDGTLKRGNYPVLDRAPNTAPALVALRRNATDLRLRYLDHGNRWWDAWPPPQTSDSTLLPRAVEWRLTTRDYGEIVRVVELVSEWPTAAADAGTVPPPAGSTSP
ncbi:MAG TPA: type II secretion system minor pseudopilin GspJ [Rudaea sp.]|nr:type II secretion system minor pseudopilin GspJ [Rudaea sp.]